MPDDKDPEIQLAEYLLEMARRKGVSTCEMKNGKMFAFTRIFIQNMLDAHPGKEEFLIFVEDAELNKPQN
jgi:hypothetical protein